MRLLYPLLAGVALTSVLFVPNSQKSATGGAAPQPKGAILHWQARVAQQVAQQGKIPDGVLYQEAVAHKQRIAAMPSASGGPTNWSLLGPGNIGGRVRSILIHPTNQSTMWTGSVSGGVWKSLDAGATWTMLPDFPAVVAVTCMVMHPQDPNTIYAGTGEECFFNNVEGSSNSAVSQGAGIFKTVDGGNTWTQLASTASAPWNSVSRLTIDKYNASILVASTISGIWRSTDSGNSWTQRTTVRTLDVEIDPNDSLKYVAGRADGIAQYSIDGGITWTNAPAFSGVTRVEVKYAKSTPGVVYASTSVGGSSLSVWRSTNGGQTYSQQASGVISTLAIYDNALWVDPTNANNVIVGGLDICRSTNAGVSFTKISNWASYQSNKTSAHADHHIIVEHPGFNGTTNATVHFGSDGGIQRAANVFTVTASSGWANLNTNLAITQLYGCCINPTSGVVLGGAQDNGTSRGTPTTGVTGWTQPGQGDGSYCAADPTNPNYFYLQSQYIGLLRSSNGGVSGTNISSGISETKPNFMAYILLDPNDANRLYVCGAALWRTNNAKNSPPTWSNVKAALNCPTSGPSDPPAHFDDNPPCNISTVAVAPGNANIVWVGHNNGNVYFTTNALAATPTWTKVDDNATALPDRWVSRIVIDKDNPSRVTVSFLGFAANGVWRSNDSGTSWSPRSGTGVDKLPSVPVSCILQHRVLGARLFAATDLGVFYSEDDGLTWKPALGGPGIAPAEELVWKNDKTMVVATHGRSIWSCDVDAASVFTVGTGCGIATPPSLTVAPPAIGSNQSYTLANAAANAPVTLLVAAGPASPTTVGPCVIQPALTFVAVAFGTTTASGGLGATLPLPASPALLGAVVTVQEFILAAGGPLLGLGELSNGAQMTFGF